MQQRCKLQAWQKKEYERFIIKLPAAISAGGKTLEGTTVRLSRKGLFVRTQQSFFEGVTVEISLAMTNNASCRLKGVVKYARNIDLMKRQNGMGIELTERNEVYEKFMSDVES